MYRKEGIPGLSYRLVCDYTLCPLGFWKLKPADRIAVCCLIVWIRFKWVVSSARELVINSRKLQKKKKLMSRRWRTIRLFISSVNNWWRRHMLSLTIFSSSSGNCRHRRYNELTIDVKDIKNNKKKNERLTHKISTSWHRSLPECGQRSVSSEKCHFQLKYPLFNRLISLIDFSKKTVH